MHSSISPVPRHPIQMLAPWQLVASLFSLQALLALHTIISPAYGTDPRLAWLPLQLPKIVFALLAVALVLTVVLRAWPQRHLAVPAFAFALFVSWFAMTIAWSPGHTYPLEKLQRLAFGTVAFFAALTVSQSRDRTAGFYLLAVAAAALVAFDAWRAWALTPAGHSISMAYLSQVDPEEAGAHYQRIGRACGVGAVIALVAWLSTRHWISRAWFMAFGLLAAPLVFGGSRGPLISLALSICMAAALTRRPRAFALIGAGVAASLAAFLMLEILPHTFARFGLNDGGRPERWTMGLEVWSTAPAGGVGIGGYSVASGKDEPSWPHNLVLELLAESGVIGLALFGALVLCCLSLCRRSYRDPIYLTALLLFVNAASNAMVSQDIPGQIELFLALGLCAGMRPPGRPSHTAEKGSAHFGSPGGRRTEHPPSPQLSQPSEAGPLPNLRPPNERTSATS